MPTTIVTKNSSTASAVPSAGSLTQGELAVNVTDKKLYTKDSGGSVVELTGLKSSDIGVSVQAYDVDTAKTDVTQSFTRAQRGAISALTDGATITPDFAVANNFSVTLGGNRTLANPSNLTAGQSGSIFVVQDGSGSRVLSWGSYWDFAGGGTVPTLSTSANSVDRIDYIVRSSTSIHAVFTGNYS